MGKRYLRKIAYREVKTFFSVSEMLECGHRFESLGQVAADPLTARHRVCAQCANAIALPPKKPSASFHPHTHTLPREASGE